MDGEGAWVLGGELGGGKVKFYEGLWVEVTRLFEALRCCDDFLAAVNLGWDLNRKDGLFTYTTDEADVQFILHLHIHTVSPLSRLAFIDSTCPLLFF